MKINSNIIFFYNLIDNFELEKNIYQNSSDEMEDDIPEATATSTPISTNQFQKRLKNKITPFQSNLLEQLKKKLRNDI